MSPFKKRGKKTERQKAVEAADAAFSLWIRNRSRGETGEMCPLCGVQPVECCFHWVSRVSYSTRWDPDNAIGSCCGCNNRMEYEPAKFYSIFNKMFGPELLEKLVRKSHQIVKLSTQDIRDIAEFFRL